MRSPAFEACLSLPSRQLSLSGEICLLTGAHLPILAEAVLSFDMSEGTRGDMLLGGAFCADCSLLLHDKDGVLSAHALLGAQVQLYLAAREEREPLACFFVTRVSHRREKKQLLLTGCDALGVAFESAWVDEGVYPQTLGALALRIAGTAGYCPDVSMPNAEIVISQMPKWGEISVRRALGYAAAALCCFARMDRAGQLEFCPAWPALSSPALPASQVLHFEGGERCFGPLAALSLPLHGAKRDAVPLQVGSPAPLAEQCLSIPKNPLLPVQGAQTDALAQGLLTALSGMVLCPFQLTWRGDPSRRVGDRVPYHLPTGEQGEMLIFGQCLTFDRGFRMQSFCRAQKKQAHSGLMFTEDGMLNAARLSGEIDGALLKDGTLAASALLAGSVTADHLAASSVTADKLAAGAVTADKLAAGAVEAAHLSADVLNAAAAHLETAQIDWAKIDSLSAVIAQITGAQLEEAEIDLAHIKDLNTDAALISRGSAGELYISRLAVTEANLLSLTVGQIVVRGADGCFYAVTVDGEGRLVSEKKQIENGDIADASIHAGEKIMEGTVTAHSLNARQIFGDDALVRRLIAENLDVDTLFARDAMIGKLHTLDITGNESIRLYVQGQKELRALVRVTEEGLEIGRFGDAAVFRADNRTMEVTNIKTERVALAQRMSDSPEWAWAAYRHGLCLKWIG